MRKNFGSKTWVYPMPVFIIATYDEEGNANAMNAAWAGVYDTNQVMLCLSDNHKTTKNIMARKAFTVSFANVENVVAADYVGIASGNKVPNKLEKAGLHVTKSEFVDAPVIDEFPMAIECKLVKFNEDGIVIGEIVNVSADEIILGEDGLVDAEKLQAIAYDGVHHTYLKVSGKVGNAFSDGKQLM